MSSNYTATCKQSDNQLVQLQLYTPAVVAEEGQTATPTPLDLHTHLHFQLTKLILRLRGALPKQPWDLLEKLLPDRQLLVQLGGILGFLTERLMR